ncbi:12875_t:CDS:2 [Entrophospora sp. SA101]|nr:12875_t:CDS:2 [Entrophospora sp. SA101]
MESGGNIKTLSDYESPKSSRRLVQQYNDEEMNDYDYKRYDQRSGGGGDDGWGTTASYSKDLEWDDYDERTKGSDKSYSSRGVQKWSSYDTKDRAPYSKGATVDRYDDCRTSYPGDRGDKYYGGGVGNTTSGGSVSGNGGSRSYRDTKQYYESDSYEWDRYNYPTDTKKTNYPDSQDWNRSDYKGKYDNNKSYAKDQAWQSKVDNRLQYPESDNGRKYEYSRGQSDRSYPPENDYEQYYSSKSRHEEPYTRNDDWDRKSSSYPRGNNDDLKRSSYDDYKNSNFRGGDGSGGGFNRGSKYPPNRGYKGSETTIPPKLNDYKRLKSYDGKSSSRYDEGSRDYDRQAGNESPTEFADEPMWEEDKYGIKSHIPSKVEVEDPNDPWGIPASPSDPNHWDNFWDDSWGYNL